MNILMFTNTFTPHVGGVARSVQQFSREFRALGHKVLIVSPEFEHVPEDERDVVRIPAVQHFNGSDFSVPVPIPGYLHGKIDDFNPDVVHSHHPFLLGDTALRTSASREIPVVFTHHTQYEKYTHYVPGDSEIMQRFVIELAVGYCNLCDAVIAPSQTIVDRLRGQGVKTRIVEIPTGVDVHHFRRGDGDAARERLGIGKSDFVVGHVGRLAPEKGLEFLSECVAKFVAKHPDAVFLIAGSGPSDITVRSAFDRHDASERLFHLGALDRNQLADVYAAMDVFAFASQSETQGMVLTEAMAARTPVVAVDASGVREVLRDKQNGLMIDHEDKNAFIDGLDRVKSASRDSYDEWVQGALTTANEFSIENTAASAIRLYEQLIQQHDITHRSHDAWSEAMRRLSEEWKIWTNVTDAAGNALLGPDKRIF